MVGLSPDQKYRRQIWIGIVISLAIPALAIPLGHALNPDFKAYVKVGGEFLVQLNSKLLTLGVLANAGLFFLMLRLNKEAMAKGIMSGSLAIFVITLVYRYLWPT